MHVEGEYAMVHAGLLPCWTVARARALAAEVEVVLAGPRYAKFLEHLWGNQPDTWRDDLQGTGRLRVIVNAMTRMRFCSLDGRMEFDSNGPPEQAPRDHLPWYAHPGRCSTDATVLFGHWSALGLRMGAHHIALDTGCVWGDRLTAVRLEDRMVFQVPAGKMQPFA
jgi:bis(5'-nucleosyl)-tetraphosphatase (symmetrical)